MKITVYGAGCHRCRETEQVVRNVSAELDLAADIERRSDWKAIIGARVVATPATEIDGEIRLFGRIPTPADVKSWLSFVGAEA